MEIKKWHNFFIRYSEAGDLFEPFLIAAVSSVIAIRVFLKLTGYPQLGSGTFHIAHMLWGGFFMMIALLSLFLLLNKEVKTFAAILGGIGFGTFIDELGKFITSDNNYFFQPSIALIYVIFIILFLIFRAVDRQRELTEKEYIVNALEITKDVFSQDLDSSEKRRALKFLNRVESNNPFINDLKQLLKKVEAEPANSSTIQQKLKRPLRGFYLNLVEQSWFKNIIIAVFLVISLFAILRVVYFLPQDLDLSFSDWGQVISAAVSGLFALFGLTQLHSSRLRAYLFFKRGVLISIFFTQVFLFYIDQLAALLGLGLSLLILLTLQYMINEEKVLE